MQLAVVKSTNYNIKLLTLVPVWIKLTLVILIDTYINFLHLKMSISDYAWFWIAVSWRMSLFSGLFHELCKLFLIQRKFPLKTWPNSKFYNKSLFLLHHRHVILGCTETCHCTKTCHSGISTTLKLNDFSILPILGSNLLCPASWIWLLWTLTQENIKKKI